MYSIHRPLFFILIYLYSKCIYFLLFETEKGAEHDTGGAPLWKLYMKYKEVFFTFIAFVSPSVDVLYGVYSEGCELLRELAGSSTPRS